MNARENEHIKRIDAPVRRQVEDRIRRAIVEGQFAPDERLVEAQLCERFRVSRPIVREALRQLVAEGLVVIVPHHGARVASITAEEASQIYEVRAQLEALAGQGFAQRARPADVEELRGTVAQLEEAMFERADGESILAIKQRFYTVMLSHCGNEIVRETLERLNNRIGQLRSLSLAEPGRLPETLNEMNVIMEAIEARNPSAAFDACAQHVQQAAKHALKALRGLTHKRSEGSR